MRLAKFIAHSGYCSRREAERLVVAGLIRINGFTIYDLSAQVCDTDTVSINGNDLTLQTTPKLWLYYKPRGVITTHSDPQGRETVFSVVHNTLNEHQFIPMDSLATPHYDRLHGSKDYQLEPEPEERTMSPQHIISVGRLDLNSEGLLLITNNGDLARSLELPGLPRKYLCRIDGDITSQQIRAADQGLTIDSMIYRQIKIIKENRFDADNYNHLRNRRNTWITIILYEGKNREIRRVMSHFDLNVSRLIRTSYGNFELGNMMPNDIMEVDRMLLTPYVQ